MSNDDKLYREDILQRFEMYDVIKLHQTVVYGPEGKLARDFHAKRGRLPNKEELNELEASAIGQDRFDHHRYQRNMYQPILSKIRAPLLIEPKEESTAAKQNGAKESAEAVVEQLKHVDPIIVQKLSKKERIQAYPIYSKQKVTYVEELHQSILANLSKEPQFLDKTAGATVTSSFFCRAQQLNKFQESLGDIRKHMVNDNKAIKTVCKSVSCFRGLDERYFTTQIGLNLAQLDYLIQRKRQEGTEAANISGIVPGQSLATGYMANQSQYGFSTALGGGAQGGLTGPGKYTGFVQSSALTGENTYALVNSNYKKVRGVAEYLQWRLKCRMPAAPKLDVMTLTAPTDTESKLNEELLNVMKSQQEVQEGEYDPIQDFAASIANIGEDIEGLPKPDENGQLPLHSCEHIEQIANIVEEVTETGVSFYFGDCAQESEKATKPYLLMNTVLALKCLQHKGSMILRLSSTLDKFTIDIIFLLYSLFESSLPFRPYAKSAYSDTTYVVFRGMKDRVRTGQVAKLLFDIYAKVLENKDKDIGALLVWEMIERDGTLLSTVTALNNETLSVRADIFRIALANHLRQKEDESSTSGPFELPPDKIWSEAEKHLSKWQVPIKTPRPASLNRTFAGQGRRGPRTLAERILEKQKDKGVTEESLNKHGDEALETITDLVAAKQAREDAALEKKNQAIRDKQASLAREEKAKEERRKQAAIQNILNPVQKAKPAKKRAKPQDGEENEQLEEKDSSRQVKRQKVDQTALPDVPGFEPPSAPVPAKKRQQGRSQNTNQGPTDTTMTTEQPKVKIDRKVLEKNRAKRKEE